MKDQKEINFVPIPPPPAPQRRQRSASFAASGQKRTRYHLPDRIDSGSPVGYRRRNSFTENEARTALRLLSLRNPSTFLPGPALTDGELFDELSLGILSSRQSTNFRGHRCTILGPADADLVDELVGRLGIASTAPGASHVHLVFSRPYRTPFTKLLTFIGHKWYMSLPSVLLRAWRKRYRHMDDIPSIGFLRDLHLGILADGMERAALLASGGSRRALVTHVLPDADVGPLEELGGLSFADRAAGWRLSLIARVGYVPPDERMDVTPEVFRRIGANLLSFRSERVQPGVNPDPDAPEPYQNRQDMDVPRPLVESAGRAAFNAFSHWAKVDRETARRLLVIERVDVLSEDGKDRLREIRKHLGEVTDRVVENLPWWADWPLGKLLSRNAERARKAFALVGQRVYIGGLSRRAVAEAGIPWSLAVRAAGAAASRSALVAEICGATAIPDGCDMLAGTCLMAGPVNQNDIGKQFYGATDLLSERHPDATSLLVWTLKAKTVADPVGNEQQLLDPARKGALVDLRAAPHELCFIRTNGRFLRFRDIDGKTSTERAFSDAFPLLLDGSGREIPGNRGTPWPHRSDPVWTGP